MICIGHLHSFSQSYSKCWDVAVNSAKARACPLRLLFTGATYVCVLPALEEGDFGLGQWPAMSWDNGKVFLIQLKINAEYSESSKARCGDLE